MSEEPLSEEVKIASYNHQEASYRELFHSPERCVISLVDLFDAVNENEQVFKCISAVFSKPEPLTILVEGSAYEQNIDVLDRILSARSNPQDSIVLNRY